MMEIPDDWRGRYVERRDGAIVGDYARPQPGLAEEPLAEDDPELVAYLAAEPGPTLIPYGVFRARWQPEELQGLYAAKNADWRVEDYVTLAAAQNHVNLTGSTAAAARALFVALDVLTEERAETIFAAP